VSDVKEGATRGRIEMPAILVFLLMLCLVAIACVIGITVVACVQPELSLTLWHEMQAAANA
jgi:hypothetical protein